jgi:hypothetical protein
MFGTEGLNRADLVVAAVASYQDGHDLRERPVGRGDQREVRGQVAWVLDHAHDPSITTVQVEALADAEPEDLREIVGESDLALAFGIATLPERQ